MSETKSIKISILGASGYTGAELVRLLALHPAADMRLLTADSKAGKAMGDVFPHLGGLDLPRLISVDEADWSGLDLVFCALPHATTQQIVKTLPRSLTVIDLSADFRLTDAGTYAEWYGHEHYAPELQPEAVYGLPELKRDAIRNARLVACPGCYPTAAILALAPLVEKGLVDPDDLIIDAKSGVSGAGRGLKENTLFCEAGEGLSPYSVAKHRHAPEIEQELGLIAGKQIRVNFTPHLVPMSRGELVTCHVRLSPGKNAADLRAAFASAYDSEPFVRLLPEGALPSTQQVRGSNFTVLNAFDDRIPGRAIVIGAIDNLVKGSSGQAIQNMNLIFGLPETMGIEQQPLFP